MLNKAGSQTTEDDGIRDVLYIAMAGTHQIWAFYLKDSTWLKGGSVHVLSIIDGFLQYIYLITNVRMLNKLIYTVHVKKPSKLQIHHLIYYGHAGKRAVES